MSEAIERVKTLIEGNEVFLFMKGIPAMPQCGFSAAVVRVLEQLGVQYASTDVLEDEAIRQAVKEYASWPTIPQLYVRGEFVGGCDIVVEMARTGELQKLVAGEASAAS